MKPVHFFSPSQRQMKWLILFSSFVILFSIFCAVCRIGYESCVVLYLQTRKIYVLPKENSIVGVLEKEIADIRKNISAKFQQKRKLQQIITHAYGVFDYYSSIARALSDTGTLTHCSIGNQKILFTAECNRTEDIDRVLDQLNQDVQFASVKLQSSEKTAAGPYIYSVVIVPKSRSSQSKKR